MNKIAKGAIAGGLGVALLLGGGATLAYWTDSAAVTGGAITSGHLYVDATGDSQWRVTNGSVDDEVTNIAAFRMVPGDTLTYEATFEVDAEGDNLLAEATIGSAALTGDAALLERLTATTEMSVEGAPFTTGAVAVEDGDEIAVRVTIVWPFGGTPASQDNPAKDQSVSFVDFNVVVEQVAQP